MTGTSDGAPPPSLAPDAGPARQRVARRAITDAGTVRLVEVLRRAEKEARRPPAESMQCEVVFRGKEDQPIPIGNGPGTSHKPRFRLILENERLFRSHITALSLGRAYVQGDLDIKVLGDGGRKEQAENLMSVFQVRDAIRSGTPASQALRLAAELALSAPTRANARAIQRDYSLDTCFYHTFLDPVYHLYSQCRFADTPETDAEFDKPTKALEDAAIRKLDHVRDQLNLEPGARILDIGAGWGGVTRYFDDLGVDVTSLTLSEDHAKYIETEVIPEMTQQGHEVIREDLLKHQRRASYDAVVILGVIEHIPTYSLFCQRVWDVLKPGRRLYLDASATKQKYAASAFTRRYTWHGPHSCLALPDLVEELLFHGFGIVNVEHNARDYKRTMRAWALRFDDNEDDIVKRWGKYSYRTFRVFLWGGAHAFHTDRLQAYTLVAERRRDPGPRPGRLRRTGQFLASLR